MYEWDFQSVWAYKELFLKGAWITIQYTIAVVIAGFVLGMVLGLMRSSRNRLFSILARCIIEPFRCTPVLVQLFWFCYALPVLIGVELTPAFAAFIALTFYGGAFYAEIVRGGIVSIDNGQREAGQALGMRRWQVMWRIVLPQAIQRMIPPLVSQSIMQLKNTSLFTVIAVPDLMYQGETIAHEIYRPLEVYTVVAIIYFAILFPITCLAQRMEVKASNSR